MYTEADIYSPGLHHIKLLRKQFILGILRKLQINYFFKTSLDEYFELTSDIFLKSQCNSKVEKSGQTMGQKNGKSDIFL